MQIVFTRELKQNKQIKQDRKTSNKSQLKLKHRMIYHITKRSSDAFRSENFIKFICDFTHTSLIY